MVGSSRLCCMGRKRKNRSWYREWELRWPSGIGLLRSCREVREDGRTVLRLRAIEDLLPFLAELVEKYQNVSWENLTPEEQDHYENCCETYETMELARQTRIRRGG